MLYIQTDYNNHCRKLIPNYMSYVNDIVINGDYEDRQTSLRRLNIEQATLPYAINEQYIRFYAINDKAKYETHLNTLLENKPNTEKYRIIRVFVDDPREAAEGMDNLDMPRDGIQELFNKCAEQVRERELVQRVMYTVRVKDNNVILFTNYEDLTQLSDVYLLLGILPALFDDIKEAFTEQEREFCRELVHRSQLKRIANMAVLQKFADLITSEKYTKLNEKLILRSLVESVVENKVASARRNLESFQNRIINALKEYQYATVEYEKASKVITDLDGSKQELKEEIRTALDMPDIAKAEVNGHLLLLTFKTKLRFFDEDEVECVMNHMSKDDIVYKILNDIFIEKKYTLNLISKFTYPVGATTTDYNMTPRVDSLEQSTYNAWFNPHIQYFSCTGDYKKNLIDAINKQDLLMFNSIAITSTASINFKDGVVINRWISGLRDSITYMQQGNPSFDTMQFIKNCKPLIDKNGVAHSIYELYLDSSNQEEIDIEVEDL